MIDAKPCGWMAAIVSAAVGMSVGLPTAAGQSRPATRPALLLSPEIYTDRTFGFSLNPPAGWTCVPSQLYEQTTTSMLVVSFRRTSRPPAELAVQAWSWMAPRSARDFAELLRAELIAELDRAKAAAPSFGPGLLEVTVAGKPAAWFDAEYELGGRKWYRQNVVIPVTETYFLAVQLTDAADRRAAATELFEQVAATVRVLDKERALDSLHEALDRGAIVLSKIAELDLAERLVEDRWFLFEDAGGKTTGYLRVRERKKPGLPEGVEILEDGFVTVKTPDGKPLPREITRDNIEPLSDVRVICNTFFVSNDQFIENWTQILGWAGVKRPRPKNLQKGFMVRDVVIGKREGIGLAQAAGEGREEGGRLLISYTDAPAASDLTDAPVIQPPPYYISEATMRMLPRLIDLDKPGIYGFASYARSQDGLITRIIGVGGPERITVAGRQYDAVKIEDRQGLAGKSRWLWVDGKGRLLKIVGDEGAVMRLSNREEVKARAEPLLSKPDKALIRE